MTMSTIAPNLKMERGEICSPQSVGISPRYDTPYILKAERSLPPSEQTTWWLIHRTVADEWRLYQEQSELLTEQPKEDEEGFVSIHYRIGKEELLMLRSGIDRVENLWSICPKSREKTELRYPGPSAPDSVLDDFWTMISSDVREELTAAIYAANRFSEEQIEALSFAAHVYAGGKYHNPMCTQKKGPDDSSPCDFKSALPITNFYGQDYGVCAVNLIQPWVAPWLKLYRLYREKILFRDGQAEQQASVYLEAMNVIDAAVQAEQAAQQDEAQARAKSSARARR